MFTLFKYMFQLQLKTILTLHIYVFIILFHFQTSKVIFRLDFLSKYANFNEVTWFFIYIHSRQSTVIVSKIDLKKRTGA